MRRLVLLLAAGAAAAASLAPPPEAPEPPEFVQAVEFPYYLYPRQLWERELVWLKNLGIRTVEFSIPWNWHQPDGGEYDFTGATSPRRDLVGFIRVLRRLDMKAWIRPLPPVKGWINNGYPPGVAAERRSARLWLHELEKVLATQTHEHGGPIAYIEGGLLGCPTPPSPVTVVSARDVAAMYRSRQALAAAHGTLLWEGVEDALYPAGWERPGTPLYRAGAVSLDGEERPTVAALRRSAALMRHWGTLLPSMKPERVRPVRTLLGKLPAGVTAAELVSRAPGAAAAISITNEGRQPFQNTVRAWDLFARHSMDIENVYVAPHESLWLPLDVSLGGAGLCHECTSFANAEHVVYATAELQDIEFENGTLAMEFAAPQAGEAVLQLARKPSGPYLAGGHPLDFDFDEKTLRARLKIPKGKGPASLVRVALAIEPPEHSAFFEEAKRLIIGQRNIVTTSYSSTELAGRSRLLVPDGFTALATRKAGLEIDYAVDVPAEALHGDWANLAIEADGVALGRAHLQLFRPASVHLADAIRLHYGTSADLPVDPPIIPLDGTAGRTVDVNIRNNAPEIRTFTIQPAGDGFQFLPAKVDISFAAVMDRVPQFRVFPEDASAGLHDWKLRFSGDARLDVPLRFLVIPRGRTVAWSADLDGDGSPEWVLENQKVRAVFSAADGGRWLEFVWKNAAPNGLNVLPENGSLNGTGVVEVKAGDGFLEFTGKEWKRTVRLAGSGAELSVEQTTPLPPDTLTPGKHNEITVEVAHRSATHAVYTLRAQER
ncbi:MAG TPA: beta-galactosidase [Bryobacteraceae bacterium]|nr:beta-galactosidase [Bryobacteraceae bacterium]